MGLLPLTEQQTQLIFLGIKNLMETALKRIFQTNAYDMTVSVDRLLYTSDLDCVPTLTYLYPNGLQWVEQFPVISIGTNSNRDNFIKCIDLSPLRDGKTMLLEPSEKTFLRLAQGDELYMRTLVLPNLFQVDNPNQPVNCQFSFFGFGFEI